MPQAINKCLKHAVSLASAFSTLCKHLFVCADRPHSGDVVEQRKLMRQFLEGLQAETGSPELRFLNLFLAGSDLAVPCSETSKDSIFLHTVYYHQK